MFHQIYELMVLGMHPASLYPRRSHVAPMWCAAVVELNWRSRPYSDERTHPFYARLPHPPALDTYDTRTE